MIYMNRTYFKDRRDNVYYHDEDEDKVYFCCHSKSSLDSIKLKSPDLLEAQYAVRQRMEDLIQ